MRASGTPVLLYHSVDTACSPAYSRWMVSPEMLAAQLDAMLASGFSPVSLHDLDGAHEPARPLPERPFAVTVDDGLADFLHALPILEARDIPVTLFVTTRYLGGTSRWLAPLGEGDRPMLDAEGVAALHARGVDIGSHAHSHAMLDVLAADRCARELRDSRELLSAIVDQPVSRIAYPHGYADARVRRLAVDAGYRSGVGVHHRLRTPEDDVLSSARLIVGGDVSPTELVAMCIDGRRRRPAKGRALQAGWRAYRRVRHGHRQHALAAEA